LKDGAADVVPSTMTITAERLAEMDFVSADAA
jgi:ABC-type amino acid transport substrate-binding protein